MSLLWPHQEEALRLIEQHEGFLVAHEMGCGKTRTVLSYIERHAPQHTLVICPKSVIPVWIDEIAKGQYPFICVPLIGSATAKIKAFFRHKGAQPRPVITLVNYDSARAGDVATALLAREWDLVVLDEIHRIKDPRSLQSLFCSKLRTRAAKRIGLTGTPMPHSPLDIWAQYRFLDPDIFDKQYGAFRWKYGVVEAKRFGGARPVPVVTGYRDLDDLHEHVYRIAHRVKTVDVLKLTGTTHQVRYVEMPPTSRRIYREMMTHLIAEVDDGVVSAANALVKILRLAQIASGHCRFDDDPVSTPLDLEKQDVLVEMLDEIGADEPVAVFCRFHADLDSIIKAAERAGRPSAELSGRVNTVGSPWRPEPGTVAAIQYQAGSVGIDLTATHHLVCWNQTQSFGNYEQCLCRVQRPGQAHPVVITHLITADSVDVLMRQVLIERRDLISCVLDKLKSEMETAV